MNHPREREQGDTSPELKQTIEHEITTIVIIYQTAMNLVIYELY